MTSTPIRVGIIGTGFMGQTHLAALKKLPNIEICGIVSRSKLRPDQGPPIYRSVDELIMQGRPDVVTVCTPTSTHGDYIRQLADKGVHVISEKPLTLSLKEARDLQQYCYTKGVQLHVAHVTRYFEEYKHVADLVTQGSLGRPGTVRLRRSVPTPTGPGNWFRDSELSGGVAVDLMIHDADFLVGLFGLPEQVVAQQVKTDSGETVLATAKFSNGAIGLLQATWGGVNELEFECEIAGSMGNAMFRSGAHGPLVLTKSTSNEPSMSFQTPSLFDPYATQLADFLDCIRSDTKKPDLEQSILALQFCLMVTQSYELARPVHQVKSMEQV